MFSLSKLLLPHFTTSLMVPSNISHFPIQLFSQDSSFYNLCFSIDGKTPGCNLLSRKSPPPTSDTTKQTPAQEGPVSTQVTPF